MRAACWLWKSDLTKLKTIDSGGLKRREKVGGGTSLRRLEMKGWPIEQILLFSVALAIKIDSYIKIIQSAHSYDSNHQQAQIY